MHPDNAGLDERECFQLGFLWQDITSKAAHKLTFGIVLDMYFPEIANASNWRGGSAAWRHAIALGLTTFLPYFNGLSGLMCSAVRIHQLGTNGDVLCACDFDRYEFRSVFDNSHTHTHSERKTRPRPIQTMTRMENNICQFSLF